MARYIIWDRTSDVFTPGINPNVKGLTYSTELGTSRYTAEEWAAIRPWVNIPGEKMILAGTGLNGGICEVFSGFVALRKQQGANITDGMTDEEILAEIERWEDEQNKPTTESTAEERIAAALEAQVMNSMETVNDVSDLDDI